VAPDRAHAVIKNAKSGDLDYVDAAGTSLRALGNPGGPGYRAVGIVGTTVYAVDGAETSTLAWDVATDRTTTLKGAVNLLNAATNRALVHVPGSVSGDGDTFCSDLVDLSSGQQLWRFCGPLRFTGFSPDGAYLMAAGEVDGLDPARTTGEYPDLVVMRTDTMDIVLRSAGTVTQPGPAAFSAAALTADDSVLTVVTASGARSLQTCALSTGACQVVEASAGRYLIAGN
jgi:hypothetical protein